MALKYGLASSPQPKQKQTNILIYTIDKRSSYGLWWFVKQPTLIIDI